VIIPRTQTSLPYLLFIPPWLKKSLAGSTYILVYDNSCFKISLLLNKNSTANNGIELD